MTESSPTRYLDSANKIRINTTTQIFNDTLNYLGANDLYSFTLKGRSSFDLNLDGLGADADVRLIRDKNANGKFDRDEKIAYSNNGGNLAESIRIDLAAGTYHIEVYPFGNIKTNYRLSVSAVPFDSAGNNFADARTVAVDSQIKSISDWVGKEDSEDYYRFEVSKTSDFKFELNGLSDDADLRLLSGQGNILASSANIGTTSELITQTLESGTYYLKVNSYNNSETFYNLDFSAISAPELIPTSANNTAAGSALNQNSPLPTSAPTSQIANGTRNVSGTLKADTFTFQSGYNRTIFSGNGNVNYGSGARDLIDLSAFISTSVAFNDASSPNGGIVYDSGYGNQIFDALTFSDGSQVLFQGIETIKFADKTINLSVNTNDPLFNQQWNLHMMGVHNSWRFTKGSTNVMIGIQDSGLTDPNGNMHPDLRQTQFVANNQVDEKWSDNADFSHGTLVQGTVAAKSNNGVGISGINWNSDLMHIDVIGNNDGDYNLAAATQAMIDNANVRGKRLVVTMGFEGGNSVAFEELIASNQGNALFIISTGNGNRNSISSPGNLAAKYDNVVAVGSSWGTQDWYGKAKEPGQRVYYDNWWGSNYGNGLTVTAPSEFVTTEAKRQNSGQFNFGYNQKFNGTTASTASVSGVASLIWSVNSNLTAGQVKEIISDTAYDLGNKGYDQYYGNGLINADAAARRALAIARGYA
ncbi:MAG: S8 family serine peptidase [Rivularia sp. ALOHA_DT_140]|nr:S8 family serine peptidase [Rivularia sp. ALOHA_DT_140]